MAVQLDHYAGQAEKTRTGESQEMKEQERLIIRLLLNEMAFEGAVEHFDEDTPDIPEYLLTQIQDIGVPQKYDQNLVMYRDKTVKAEVNATVFEKCYAHLRTVRNNIIHANKAYKPDTPERLIDLLEWADRFITAVYETDSSFAGRAMQIKREMQIESF